MTREIELMREQLTDLQTVAIRVDINVEHVMGELKKMSERLDEHSDKIDETASQVARWKAMGIDSLAVETSKTVSDWKSKANLILAVASFVGIGGFVSMVALVAKLYMH